MTGILIFWVVCAGIAWAIGNSKGRAVAGFWYGLLLGIFGVIIAVCMKPVSALPERSKAPQRMFGESNRVYEERIARLAAASQPPVAPSDEWTPYWQHR